MAQITCKHPPSWQLYVAELVRQMGGYRQLVCLGAGTATTIEQAIAAELIEANGYNRKTYAPGPNVYSATNKRVESPAVNNSLQASGTSLQYDSSVLLFDSSPNANKGFVNTDVNVAGNAITIASHGLTNGEAIMITADPGSTLIGSLSGTTLYYAANVTANTFQVSTTADGSAIATFSNAGAGNMRLRYAKGRLVWVGNYGSVQTILDGASRTLTINTELHDSGYTVGV